MNQCELCIFFINCVYGIYLRKDKASIVSEYFDHCSDHYSNVILSKVADKSVSDKLLSSSTGVMSPLWSLELLDMHYVNNHISYIVDVDTLTGHSR